MNFSDLVFKGRELPIGTKRKHGGVMKVKTPKGWVPVKGEKKSKKGFFEELFSRIKKAATSVFTSEDTSFIKNMEDVGQLKAMKAALEKQIGPIEKKEKKDPGPKKKTEAKKKDDAKDKKEEKPKRGISPRALLGLINRRLEKLEGKNSETKLVEKMSDLKGLKGPFKVTRVGSENLNFTDGSGREYRLKDSMANDDVLEAGGKLVGMEKVKGEWKKIEGKKEAPKAEKKESPPNWQRELQKRKDRELLKLPINEKKLHERAQEIVPGVRKEDAMKVVASALEGPLPKWFIDTLKIDAPKAGQSDKDLVAAYHKGKPEDVKKLHDRAQELIPGVRLEDSYEVVATASLIDGPLPEAFIARMKKEGRVTRPKMADVVSLAEAKKVREAEKKAENEKPSKNEFEKEHDLPKIPFGLDLARQAHSGTSHVPEKRAQQEQRDFYQHISDFGDQMANVLAANPSKKSEIIADYVDYKVAYRKKTHERLRARAKVMSAAITGPAKFPTRRNDKASNAYEKKTNELLDWTKKNQKKILNKYSGKGPISMFDDDAVGKLKAKIEQAKKDQEQMKAGNKVMRNKKMTNEEKVKKLVEMGFKESTARTLMEPDYAGRRGYAQFELANNNANIKRMEARVREIEREKETSTAKDTDFKADVGGTLIDNEEENRIQLKFDGKPSDEMRTKLKRNGFRWSPSRGVWQAYRNDRTRGRIKDLVGIDPFKTGSAEDKEKTRQQRLRELGNKMFESMSAKKGFFASIIDAKQNTPVPGFDSTHPFASIVKAKALPVGTKRKHGDVMKVKTAQGWVPVKEGRQGAAEEEESPKKQTKIDTGSESNVEMNAKQGGPLLDSELQEFMDANGGGEFQTITEKIGGKDQSMKIMVPKDPERVKKAWGELKNQVRDKIGKVAQGNWEDTLKWRNDSVKSSDEMFNYAKASEKQFQDLVAEIAKPVKGEPNFGPDLNGDGVGDFTVKGKGSLERKVKKRMEEFGASEEEILQTAIQDGIRGTIVVETPEQLGNMVRAAAAKFEKEGIEFFVENKFTAEKNYSGYVAVDSLIKMPAPDYEKTGNTITAELQFHCRAFNNGTDKTPKEQAHKLYEMTREMSSVPTTLSAASFVIFATALGRLV